MQQLNSTHYSNILTKRQSITQETCIIDHLNGFDKSLSNKIFNALSETGNTHKIYTQYVIDENLQQKYQNL
jgi:hypothetical protein